MVYAEDFSLEQLEALINSGADNEVISEGFADYLRMMEMARDWYYKMKSRQYIIKHLCSICNDKKGKPISPYKAKKIFMDAMNFFYMDQKIHKQSYRNIYAERLELAASVAWEQGDMDTYGLNIVRASKVRQLDFPDKETADDSRKKKRNVFYVLEAKKLGLPEPNRRDVARFIDNLEIVEKEKVRLKQDAGVEERELFNGE